MRSLMENLVELAGDGREIVVSAMRRVTNVQIQSELPWTVTFRDNMSNSQIYLEQHRDGAAVENELKEFLAELESWYVKVCRAGSNMEYQVAIEVPEKSEKDPEKYQAAIKSLRLLVCSGANDVDEVTGKGDLFADMFAPKEMQILSRRRPNIRIALQARAEFRTFPGSRDALLERHEESLWSQLRGIESSFGWLW